jgi:signal transduction histidine kinase
VALIDIGITAILFIIAVAITRNFEKLAELSHMKSEFINIISHQLRAPLTNLKWAVEYLTSENLENDKEKKEEYNSSINKNVERMVELVDNLLIVSRLEQDKIPFQKKEVSLEEVVETFITQFKAFAEASNIKIDFVCEKNLPKIFADISQIKLVVENLIDNAIRYTKGGQISIELKRKNNKHVFFSIKDSGVGIPQKDQMFIFQKFFRAENALRAQTRGSGLGLYIVKVIVEKLGGKIWFESEEGQGTTFYFTLPIE